MSDYFIAGCGDIGRRIAQCLLNDQVKPSRITGLVHQSFELAATLGINVLQADFDTTIDHLITNAADTSILFYTIAPQKHGETDQRSRRFVETLTQSKAIPKKVILLSTTGVYGDQQGEWVDETTPTAPQTGRGKRRLNMEQQWHDFCQPQSIPLITLRVPGIYAYSRLPRARIEKSTPVVRAQECGYTNRIHADDLAAICVHVAKRCWQSTVFNATDGHPGKISEYLQAAAAALSLPALPEISMREAQGVLSEGMLSYLRESRKISNEKLLRETQYVLLYPDFLEGIKHG